MNRYETLILSVPEITAEEVSKLEVQLNKMVKTSKGNTISFEKWGKYRLAYPVRKNEYGVYFLSRFELPNEEKDAFFSELKNLFAIKYHEIVMRNIVSAFDKDASMEYQRPRSLEEGPQEDFMNKKRDSRGDFSDDENDMFAK